MAVSSHPFHGRVPRAHRDPIFSASDAMAIFALQMTRPLCSETLVMFLDDQGCGTTLISVADTDDPFQILDVAEAMALTADALTDIDALVIATVRPGGCLLPGDDELWLEAADLVDDFGLTLIDWLIVGRHGTVSPREQLGMPSRWPCGT